MARVAAEMLKKRFRATRVVVFGSLARKSVFTQWSDIDLAVWGVAPEEYYRAAGATMDIGLEDGFRVDVVDASDWREGSTFLDSELDAAAVNRTCRGDSSRCPVTA